LASLKPLVATLRFVLSHPLNRNQRLQALWRDFRWQLGARIVSGPVAVPFVNGCVLLAEPGMTGATGNIYCGLAEFESMSLVGHSLKSGDLFVDVGANIGSYTLLAASLGAKCLALEPIPTTFLNLQRNIGLNGVTRVTALEVAVGSKRGTLTMTSDFDTVNHVITNEEPGIGVQVWRLDDLVIIDRPLGLKIDVEG